MGIRFYCPNGHKLNVKEFLAGQRGICPRCGERVDIPLQSTRAPGTKDLPIAAEWELRRQKEGKQPGKQPKKTVASGSGSIEYLLSTLPVQQETQPDLPASEQDAIRRASEQKPLLDIPSWSPEPTSAPQEVEFSPLPTPTPAPETASRPRLPDPFEGPADTVWYVRPTAGGQYGPVDRDVVQLWLSEGRIVGDTLVWKEGWTDWKRGDEIFETLAPAWNAPPIAPFSAPPQEKKKSFWGFGN